jgi:transposase
MVIVMNAYSLDLRERAMEYLDSGHTYKQTSELFMVTMRTLFNWSRLRQENGDLSFKNTPRSPHKLDNEELLEYIKKNPDAYLQEISAHFKCCKTAAYYALKRLKVTHKKNKRYIVKEMRRSVKSLLNS